MFQNPALDVAIALMLMYLMLSLLCTVVNEFIATKLKLRAKSLASAIERMIDDPPLREAFYKHGLIASAQRAASVGTQSAVNGLQNAWAAAAPAIASRVRNMLNRTPSGPPPAPPAPRSAPAASPASSKDHSTYLSGRSVALALIASLDTSKPLPGMADIENKVKLLPSGNIRDALLSSLTEAQQDIDKLRTSIATWFDDSMARLSGAYKRQLKWISMLIGIVVAVVFNADTFNVATTLWTDQARRESVVAMAAKAPQSYEADKPEEAVKKINSMLQSLPIGWKCDAKASAKTASAGEKPGYWNQVKTNARSVTLIQILGWMVTAAALTLGAPFWFDVLQKFVNIRGAGAKPKREDEKTAA
jgi:hypothetical protein